MIQRAVLVPVDLRNGSLDLTELNAALADGWLVVTMANSTPGSILVILEKP